MTWASRWLAITTLTYFCTLALRGVTICGTVYVPMPGCRGALEIPSYVEVTRTDLIINHLMVSVVLESPSRTVRRLYSTCDHLKKGAARKKHMERAYIRVELIASAIKAQYQSARYMVRCAHDMATGIDVRA